MHRSGAIRIGISGWIYQPWRGTFYPQGLAQKEELEYASSIFRSIEINGTFYRQQTPTSFAKWAGATPNDFQFAVKAPRFITHILRLRRAATPLANFLASGLLRLGPKLGPILWQFPPNFRFDNEQLNAFLDSLPRDTEAAAALGKRHDRRLKARAWLRSDSIRPVRHAIEVRHESFRDPAFVATLRKHNVALVCADTPKWPRLMDITADFIYCRLHGSEDLYRSPYDDAALERWVRRIRAWSTGKPMRDGEFVGTRAAKATRRDVFLYFDNTDKVHAPRDACRLAARLGGSDGAKK